MGKAVIKTVIKDNIIKEYSINIQKVDNNDITKNLIFEITDESLINETGGIVHLLQICWKKLKTKRLMSLFCFYVIIIQEGYYERII